MIQTGTVVRWVEGRFGWIVGDDSKPSLFFHYTKAPKDCTEGMRVEFQIGEGDKGSFAFNIKPTDKPAPARKKRAKV